MSSTEELSTLLRLENAAVSYLTYLVKTLWPADLAVFYPLPSYLPLWKVAGSLLVLVALTLAVLRAGRRHPYLPVGWLWFLVTLFPVIGILQVGIQAWADRFSYIPVIGLFIVAAWGVPEVLGRREHASPLPALLGGCAVLACAALSYHQLGFWRDNVTLYRHAIAVNPAVPKIHNNLGLALKEKGDLEGAIREYREALRYSSDLGKTHNNLGLAYAALGDLAGAIGEYREAIRVEPDYAEARNNLGIALMRQGDLEGAIREYRTALKLKPGQWDVYNNLGQALAGRGDAAGAIQAYGEALRINPENAMTHNNLGVAYIIKGDRDAAIREFREALAKDPGYSNARNNLQRASAEQAGAGR